MLTILSMDEVVGSFFKLDIQLSESKFTLTEVGDASRFNEFQVLHPHASMKERTEPGYCSVVQETGNAEVLWGVFIPHNVSCKAVLAALEALEPAWGKGSFK